MAKEVVTLYIDDISLRLLVVKGKQVEKWAELPLEPGLVKDGLIIAEAEAVVAAKIVELLEAQEVKTRRIITGLSGLHSLFRLLSLPPLPKAMLAEAVRQEAAKEMSVPLQNLHLSWQVIPSPGEETQVFLAALPRNTADAMLRTLNLAGVDPYLMDIAPLALARVADEATAIIVDVRTTEFDIVIMVDGIPQPIRSLSLPHEAVSEQEKLAIIKEELDRTIKFYNSSHPNKPLDPSLPIFVSGELAQNPEACQSLANELGYSMATFPSPLDCTEDLAPSQYMVNIGLALKEISLPGVAANFSVVNLNVLPRVYQPKPRSLAKILIVPTIIIAIGLLVPLVMLIQNTAAKTESLQTQLDTTNQLLTEKQAEWQAQNQALTEDIAELETQIAEAEVSRDALTAATSSLNNLRLEVNDDLSETTRVLPAAIKLTRINYFGDGLTISGVAPSETEVLTYASYLRASNLFSQVVISSMEKTEDKMNFTLILNHRG
jgi:type IV pilus assembly protein PilM